MSFFFRDSDLALREASEPARFPRLEPSVEGAGLVKKPLLWDALFMLSHSVPPGRSIPGFLISCGLFVALCLGPLFAARGESVPNWYRKQAKNQPSFEEIQANPEAYIGQIVILGGTILQAENRKSASFL
ncbi:MAG: Slp family lipoprotein, partial [Methylacidiphilaceae bacterium]|nr:Slp family lipoprotein [Candidatus Methylacidiphilaceae bacterium]